MELLLLQFKFASKLLSLLSCPFLPHHSVYLNKGSLSIPAKVGVGIGGFVLSTLFVLVYIINEGFGRQARRLRHLNEIPGELNSIRLYPPVESTRFLDSQGILRRLRRTRQVMSHQAILYRP